MRRHIVLIILLYASEAAAHGARIRDLTAEVIEGQIVASFELKQGFNKKIIRDIHDGIEKNFYYYIVLQKKYKRWFDQDIAETTLRYSVKYDTIKKIYRVSLKNGEALQFFDRMEDLEAFVSKIDRVPLAPQALLEPYHRYFVRVKAQMKAAHVPLALDRFLFFIPFLDLDTPWAQSQSLYAP